jgi:hypothetical protein
MFQPAVDAEAADAEIRLQELGESVERLADDWSAFLQQNLQDPVAQEGLRLLSETDARAAQAAATGSDVPDATAVQALNTVFSGLQKVSLGAEEVLAALRRGGPATRTDLQQRLETLLADRLAGADPTKARIVIE